MRSLLNAFCVILFLVSCEQNSRGDRGTADTTQASPNQALYERVMSIHDSVMPQMNDLHKAKTSLQTRLGLPGLGEDERQEIQGKISRIDSASESMMVWMRQFNPLPDSIGEAKARAYLEGELVKIREVQDKIQAALNSATPGD